VPATPKSRKIKTMTCDPEAADAPTFPRSAWPPKCWYRREGGGRQAGRCRRSCPSWVALTQLHLRVIADARSAGAWRPRLVLKAAVIRTRWRRATPISQGSGAEVRVADDTLPSRTACIRPHHVGARAGLIYKHQMCGVKHALLSSPTPPRAGAIGLPPQVHRQALAPLVAEGEEHSGPLDSVAGGSGCSMRWRLQAGDGGRQHGERRLRPNVTTVLSLAALLQPENVSNSCGVQLSSA
jgi:hypothetical protein